MSVNLITNMFPKDVKGNLFLYSLYVFFSFPFLITIQLRSLAIVIGVIIQLYLLFSNNKACHSWKHLSISLFPFVFYLLSFFYSDNIHYAFSFLEKTLSFYIIPIVFYFNRKKFDQKTFHHVLKYFSTGMSFFMVYLLIGMVFISDINQYIIENDIHYVIRTNLETLSNLHPTYLSLLITISLLIIQNELKTNKLTIKSKYFLYVQLFVMSVVMLLATSKMIMASSIVVSILFWFSREKAKSVLIKGVAFCAVIVVLSIAINPIRERFVYLKDAIFTSGVDESNPDSMRKAIYISGWDVIEENFWLGTGVGDQQDELNKKYKTNNFSFALKNQFNTHNQYLQFWLSCGVFSLLAFIYYLFYLIKLSFRYNNKLFLSIIVLFVLSFFTENILVRQAGVFAFVLFINLFVYTSIQQSE